MGGGADGGRGGGEEDRETEERHIRQHRPAGTYRGGLPTGEQGLKSDQREFHSGFYDILYLSLLAGRFCDIMAVRFLYHI